MPTHRRKARHRSEKHKELSTAEAILAVAEDICAQEGPAQLKLSDIAAGLGIETPSLYRHYEGLNGVIGALACTVLQAEIETFSGLDELTFEQAVRTQASRLFDLYMARPGLARFMNVHLAMPRGLTGFKGEKTQLLAREFYRVENKLFQKGLDESAIRPLSDVTFLALRFGAAIFIASMFHSRPALDASELQQRNFRVC